MPPEILKKDGKWGFVAGQLKFGDELKPFYRIPANYRNARNKFKQFPRVFSFQKGWMHERQFVDEWKSGKTTHQLERFNKAVRMIGGGLSVRQIAA
jgi:hypothetical protein